MVFNEGLQRCFWLSGLGSQSLPVIISTRGFARSYAVYAVAIRERTRGRTTRGRAGLHCTYHRNITLLAVAGLHCTYHRNITLLAVSRVCIVPITAISLYSRSRGPALYLSPQYHYIVAYHPQYHSTRGLAGLFAVSQYCIITTLSLSPQYFTRSRGLHCTYHRNITLAGLHCLPITAITLHAVSHYSPPITAISLSTRGLAGLHCTITAISLYSRSRQAAFLPSPQYHLSRACIVTSLYSRSRWPALYLSPQYHSSRSRGLHCTYHRIITYLSPAFISTRGHNITSTLRSRGAALYLSPQYHSTRGHWCINITLSRWAALYLSPQIHSRSRQAALYLSPQYPLLSRSRGSALYLSPQYHFSAPIAVSPGCILPITTISPTRSRGSALYLYHNITLLAVSRVCIVAFTASPITIYGKYHRNITRGLARPAGLQYHSITCILYHLTLLAVSPGCIVPITAISLLYLAVSQAIVPRNITLLAVSLGCIVPITAISPQLYLSPQSILYSAVSRAYHRIAVSQSPQYHSTRGLARLHCTYHRNITLLAVSPGCCLFSRGLTGISPQISKYSRSRWAALYLSPQYHSTRGLARLHCTYHHNITLLAVSRVCIVPITAISLYSRSRGAALYLSPQYHYLSRACITAISLYSQSRQPALIHRNITAVYHCPISRFRGLAGLHCTYHRNITLLAVILPITPQYHSTALYQSPPQYHSPRGLARLHCTYHRNITLLVLSRTCIHHNNYLSPQYHSTRGLAGLHCTYHRNITLLAVSRACIVPITAISLYSRSRGSHRIITLPLAVHRNITLLAVSRTCITYHHNITNTATYHHNITLLAVSRVCIVPITAISLYSRSRWAALYLSPQYHSTRGLAGLHFTYHRNITLLAVSPSLQYTYPSPGNITTYTRGLAGLHFTYHRNITLLAVSPGCIVPITAISLYSRSRFLCASAHLLYTISPISYKIYFLLCIVSLLHHTRSTFPASPSLTPILNYRGLRTDTLLYWLLGR
ncbi:unnamed protein product [Acanthosepion pharaonis]|uniref:Uncharacterized protein n=1 Tax=Acanthosepion pharaonis TaxID=158019 RepID=A0A812CBG2_ACAPH|nr:unnamed protein product [Sepia pharaonis]